MEIPYHLILIAVKMVIIHFAPNLFASPKVILNLTKNSYYIINLPHQRVQVAPNPTLIHSIVDSLVVDSELRAIVEESPDKVWLWRLTPPAAFLDPKSIVPMRMAVLVLGKSKVSLKKKYLAIQYQPNRE